TMNFDPRKVEAAAQKKQVIIGGGAVQHDERTAAIDLSQVGAFMGSQPHMQPGMQQPGMQPNVQRPRQIPGRPPPGAQMPQQSSGGGFMTALIIFFVLVLLGGGAAFVFLYVLADDDKKSSSGGGSAEEEGPSEPTFEDRIATAKQAPTARMAPPIEGEEPTGGLLVSLNGPDGLYVDGELLVAFSGGGPSPEQFESGTSYLTDFGLRLNEKQDASPILIVADIGVSLKTLYPVLYTAATTGRRVLLAGDTVTNP